MSLNGQGPLAAAADGRGEDRGMVKSASFPPMNVLRQPPASPRRRGCLKPATTTPWSASACREDLLPLSFIPEVDSPKQSLAAKRVSFAVRLPSNEALSSWDEELSRSVDMSDLPCSCMPTSVHLSHGPAPLRPPGPSPTASSEESQPARGGSPASPLRPASPTTPRPASPFRHTTSLLSAMLRRAARKAPDGAAACEGGDSMAGGAAEAKAEAPCAGVAPTTAPTNPTTAGQDHIHLWRQPAASSEAKSEEGSSEDEGPAAGEEDSGWAMYLGGFGCSPDLAAQWAS